VPLSRVPSVACAVVLVFFACFPLARRETPAINVRYNANSASEQGVLGFDRNEYPGDGALPGLRQRFVFSGYWLNAPPGSSLNNWSGKREILRAYGFGFLVLFNGRSAKETNRAKNAAALGASDARAAIEAARREGFHEGTVIFLDQEEGGRMLRDQRAYIHGWVDAVNAARFRAGVYCSGMPSSEGHGISVVTADDIRSNADGRSIVFFVYNDACPPSPGCVYPANPPAPSASGVAFAAVWQFAQSPRRHEYTQGCAASYSQDDKCYAPSPESVKETVEDVYVDLDTASSADPSNGRE
jgi:Domain of unknown function (DUF1906)